MATKKPKGLGITRDKQNFTFSWKIGDKDYKDGQQAFYTEHYTKHYSKPVSKRITVTEPIIKKGKKKGFKTVTRTIKAISQSTSTNTTIKKLGKKDTKKTVKIDFNKYYPKKNIYLTSVSFSVRGNRDKYKKDGKTKDPGWSEYSTKDFDIKSPNPPSVSSGLGTYSNQCVFAWSSVATDDSTTPLIDYEWQSLILKGDNTALANGHKLNWSKAAKGVEQSTTKGKTFDHDDSSLFIGDYSFTRWFRIRSRGPGGPSAWKYSKYTFAIPNASKSVKANLTPLANGTYRCAMTWAIDVSNLKPLTYAELKYSIASPIVTLKNVEDPKTHIITKVASISHPTPESISSWSDVPGGKLKDTPKADGWTFNVDESVSDNKCLWVRVNSVYSVHTTTGTPIKASGAGSTLSNPKFERITPYGDRATIEVTNTAAEAIPNSFVAIYYRLKSNPKKASCIGIIPPGSTSETITIPTVDASDVIDFGIQAYVASYSPIEPEISGVTTYSITNIYMKSALIWDAGRIPKPPELALTSPKNDTIQANWSWSWSEANSAELSWSQDEYAWESTNEPETYTVSNIYSSGGSKATQWRISNLGVGTWYVRVRLIKTTGDTVTYGTYSKIEEINLASAPAIPELRIQPTNVTIDGTITCSWAYVSNDGTGQSQADICIATVDENTGECTYSDPIRKTGSVQSTDIKISDFVEDYNWKEDDTILLCVRVSSLSGETALDWSKPTSFHIVKKPTISIDVDNTSVHEINIPSGMTDDTVPEDGKNYYIRHDDGTYTLVSDPTGYNPSEEGWYEMEEGIPSITQLPIIVAVTDVGETGDVTASITRREEFDDARPDEDEFHGFKGETICYGVSRVGDGNIIIDLDNLVTELNDEGKYYINVTHTDDYGQTADDHLEFDVHWAQEYQAVMPSAEIEVDSDRNVCMITPLMPETGYSEGDTCDIYRLSVDKPQLIYHKASMNPQVTYVDPYPTLGRFGGYRIVYYTKYGDYTIEDPITHGKSYAWEDYTGDNYTLDLFATIIDFGGDQVILPYDISLSTKWSKDFKQTRYLGGSVRGDWNPGVLRDTTINTRVVVVEDPDVIASMRRLADYTGVCNVRTPDGSSYHADVEVQEDREEKWVSKLASFTLSVKRVDRLELDGLPYDQWIINQEGE